MSKVMRLRGTSAWMLVPIFLAIAMPFDEAFAQKPGDEGAHILAMVVRLATREETLATGEDGALGILRSNGIFDEDIVDGTVAAGITYCCGGKVSLDTRILFYVPSAFSVAEGDIVEIRMGRAAKKRRGETVVMNRAVAVRESIEDLQGACHWDPEDDRLWMRILYCDWMPEEGWRLERGLDKKWFKPATVAL